MALAAFASNALSEPAAQGAPPDAVTEAVAASPAPGSPAKVVVGAYINDIQELDFKSNSYAIDLYVWFRWTPAADFDPSKSMEFMNRYTSDGNVRDELYDKPKPMPDGSVYSIIRYQGQLLDQVPARELSLRHPGTGGGDGGHGLRRRRAGLRS